MKPVENCFRDILFCVSERSFADGCLLPLLFVARASRFRVVLMLVATTAGAVSNHLMVFPETGAGSIDTTECEAEVSFRHTSTFFNQLSLR